MVFDLAANLDFYRTLGINGRYAKAVDFLQNTDLKALEPGIHEIDGTDVFANVMEYTTLPWEEAVYETHRDYTDIQYMIEGSEIITYAPVGELVETHPYDEEKDITKYADSVPGLRAVVKAGEYMIFQPWDGHKPKAEHGQAARIKKVVVKIKEN